MYYEDDERDPFEGFGEADEALEEAEEIEADADFDAELEQAALAAAPEPMPANASQQTPKPPFSWAGFMGGFAAILWIGAAIGGPLSYYGIDAMMTLDPAMQAGLIALAFGPALLFWVAASAAGEAMKARALAGELARLAHDARAPLHAHQADAQRLGAAVRNEIDTLNDAVAAALGRLAELEHSAQRSVVLFGEAVGASRENTEAMINVLQHEREALASVNNELRDQSETVTLSVGRQVRLMREASRMVKGELQSAESALQTQLNSFSSSSAMIGERTSALHQAAEEASAAATSLNGVMANMLDNLSEATRLASSAQKSSEEAVRAASETAGALRETTRTAVSEAKRAAQLIRAESEAMQESAIDTLSKLQDAAHAARAASEESQAAADRHAAAIEKRLSALAATAGAARKAPTAPLSNTQPTRERTAERAVRPRVEAPSLHAAASAAIERSQPAARAETPRRAFKGFGSWGNFMPQSRAEETPAPANDGVDLMNFRRGARKDHDTIVRDNALDLVTEAGVNLDDVLGPGDLDRIARRSRDGALARRAAVVDAAPGAVTRVARYVRRNDKAHLAANEFRSRPDLAKSENKAEGSDLVRAYLLIDAALA